MRDLTMAGCTGMKMFRKTAILCLAVLLTLSSVYGARRRLNSISELKKRDLYKNTNINELLHWFANTVQMVDNSDNIRLNFDPNSDYGSHRYRNDERILDPPPAGYQYYTVGNINRPTSKPLPSYVVDAQRGSTEWNKARIIFRVREENPRIIDQVYITQHYDGQSSYDPDHTYEVSMNLLRALRRDATYDMEPSKYSVVIGPFGNASDAPSQQHSFPNREVFDLHATGHTQQKCCKWTSCQISGCIAGIIIIIIIIGLGVYFGLERK